MIFVLRTSLSKRDVSVGGDRRRGALQGCGADAECDAAMLAGQAPARSPSRSRPKMYRIYYQCS